MVEDAPVQPDQIPPKPIQCVEFFMEHHAEMVRYAVGLVGEQHAADIVQLASMAILRSKREYLYPGRHLAWCRKVVQRAAIDYWRRQRNSVPFEDLNNFTPGPVTQPTVLEALAARSELEHIRCQ